MISAIHKELGVPPLDDEVLAAKMTSKSGKAGGKNGMLPEMMKFSGVPCWND